MTADEKIIRAQGQVVIPSDQAVLCASLPGHVYDGFNYEKCPACGAEERIGVEKTFSASAGRSDIVRSLLDDPDLSWTGPRAQEWRAKLMEVFNRTA